MYILKGPYKKKILIALLTVFTVSLPPGLVQKERYPLFRLVLDPGHGGLSRYPGWKYGDKYDPLSGKYLESYKEGATYRGIRERDVVYSIAQKVERILLHCSPEGDFEKFKEILKKYTADEPHRITIVTKKSRGKSLSGNEFHKMDDPNGGYRFFDFPGQNGEKRTGRLSIINSFKPHLVLSLHHAVNPPMEKMGLNPVLVPSYDILHRGLRYLRGEKNLKNKLNGKIIRNWFNQDSIRGPFGWFISDVSYYFTGYPLSRRRKVDYREFSGYRYNMISWAYSDEDGWEKEAISHKSGTRYSKNFRNVKPEGKFWERERSKYEKFRREGGMEGYGGDNSYASNEIIRYILYALSMNGLSNKRYFPGNPYVSVWIVPLHLNAISPFIELGYLRKKWDRFVLTRKQDIIAEGIAVGIYSLFAGLEIRDNGYRHTPRGKKIDLEKYRITNDKSYFDSVTE